MKKILILYTNFLCLSISSQNLDSVKYTIVYNYIDSSDYVASSFEKYFKSQNETRICISKQLIIGESIAFLKEIIEYEYPNEISKDSIENILWEEYNNQIAFVIDTNCIAKKYFPKIENCNLIVFFSEIDSNKIFVDIELFIDRIDNYKYILNTLSPVAVLGLFYLKENKIDRVYLKKIQR
jgi:hypothetical protein